MNDRNPHPTTSYNSHALHVLEFDRVRGIVASHADSAEGKAILSAIMPLDNAGEVRALLAETDELMTAMRFDDALPGIQIHDIKGVFPLMRIEGVNLGIENIAAVADNLETAHHVAEYFREKGGKYPLIHGIVEGITRRDDIERRIRKAITPDLEIADDASPELKSIRRRLDRARRSLRELVEKTLSSLPDDIVAERTVTIRNNRYVIPVRDNMKNRIAGAVHDRSQTGKTLFVEPLASIEGNNLVLELEMAEQAEILRILLELSALVSSAAEELVRNQNILVRLDTIKAKARYGVRVEGVIPRIGDRPEIRIRKGRHPLLDWKFRKQEGGAKVVPLDLRLGDGWVTVVVTGPNAGGKTVALKTAGLLTVMALAGFPVPAGEDTTVSVPSGVFSDIGDEQSIEDDLSTFSAHMSQIVTVLRDARAGALVLLDELGGGTNPADGEAIALAVLKKLTALGALTVATTHHDGLKVFAHETEGVINASMEFDNDGLRPTFVFREGVPGSSYAFEIAARMGMPADVLREAESLAGGERKSLEGLVAEMEEQLRLAELERRASAEERLKMQAAREDYERKREDITRRKDEMLAEAAAESKKILEGVNRRIETSIREIRETKAAHDAIVHAKTEVGDIRKDVEKIALRAPSKPAGKKRRAPGKAAPGAVLWSESLASSVVVEELLDEGRKARVRVGRHKASFVVNTSDLFEEEGGAKQAEQVVRVNVSAPAVEKNELDIRGMTFDDAYGELERFLDAMHLAGMSSAMVIHGKGTGVLRKKVLAYLETHPYVMEYRLGNWNEGSSGVTVVTLKS